MIHENSHKKIDFNGAKGLVFIGTKIIAYRRDKKTNLYPLYIDLPGGLREQNESPFDTFQREIREECGITIEKGDIHFSCMVESLSPSNKKSYFFVTRPLEAKSTEIVFRDEGMEWTLMTPEEFIKHPDGIEQQQKRIEKYLTGKMVSE